MRFEFLFGLLAGVFGANVCPCTVSVDPLAVSALTSFVYPVIECDQICGPPALAYEYYSFEEPLGPCNCYSNSTSLNGHYYANSTSSVNLYYQNDGLASICDPCFPSPTPSPSPSPTVSPSGMCYVVHNLLYGKVYTDGYYTVVHGINASHAYNPSPIILGKNPTCTESPGICTCAYTGGSTFSCPYTRSATLRYQYGSTTTMTFVNESPVCRYTFNMFINFDSPTPTSTVSPSFTPAGSPTVSKTTSVSLTPSVSPSRTSSVSITMSISSSLSVSQTPSPTISDSEIPILQFIRKAVIPSESSVPITSNSNSDSITGIVLGSVSVLGAIGIVGAHLLQTKNSEEEEKNHKETTEQHHQETRTRLSTIEEETSVEGTETIPDNETVTEYREEEEVTAVVTLNPDEDDDHIKQKTLLQLDTEDVEAVMQFLQQRMKSATVLSRMPT